MLCSRCDAAVVLAEGSVGTGYSGVIHNGHGALTGPGAGLGPAAWNRSLERALEEAAVTGVLNLSGRKLRDFPRSAARQDLSDTTQADLSRNRLAEIPAEICHYVSLESLNLYQNCIRYVPEATVNLQALTFLNISRNQLTSLPGYLCNLPLKVLITSNNKLDCLPEEIGNLRLLTELDVSCNEIQTIPTQIGKLESLRDLNIRRNHLVHLPEELAELPLVRLDFSCNKVTSIPLCYRNLRHLQTITLDNNPLQTPPAQICIKGKFHIFKYLNIEACKSAPDLPDYERRPLGFNTCHDDVYTGRPYGALDSGFNSVDSGDKRWSGNETTEEFTDLHLRGIDVNRDHRIRRDQQPHELRSSLLITNGGVEHDLEQIDYIDSYGTEEEDEDLRHSRGDSLSSQFMAYIEDRRVSHEASPVKLTPSRLEEERKHSHQARHREELRRPESLSLPYVKDRQQSPRRAPLDASYLLSITGSPSQKDTEPLHRRDLESARREAQLAAQRYEEERMKDRLLNSPSVRDTAKHRALSHDKQNPQESESDERTANSPVSPTSQTVIRSSSPSVTSYRYSPQRPESFLFRAAVREEGKRGNTPPPTSDPANSRPDQNTKLKQEEQEVMEQLRKNIELRLKVSLPNDLGAALTDGVVLCHLANHVRPRSVSSIHVPSPAVPKLTMAKCRRNVENFLEACRKIGVPQDRLCLPPHILEESGLMEVAGTVQALLDLAPPKHLSPTTV
ncbi:LOW QUALITY PROTEIN: DISP complex protein LRCH3 [Bombina bombina]|uniref:LOW QUALITY PROTEIN: DISP complex protein LRCH3 n=1 Tax=Bombina bombina TaxID=8345 RepID=UPI00235B2C72|nr:LOW QUALITY PROTEIN: DISP complex protein LRCH3 [Bombina bombina]